MATSGAPAEPGEAMAPPAASVAGGLAVYLDRRVIAILFLGFAAGLPLLLVIKTLSAWLTESGIDKGTIGLFGYVIAPYSVKFLWAPVIDQLPAPWLAGRLGRRRGWLLLTQLALIAAIFGLGQTQPGENLLLTALFAGLVAFCSASQDIVIDAYRIESLPEELLAAGSANYVTGYRIGMWLAGAGALYLADVAGWSTAYAVMALTMLVGVGTTLLCAEPPPPDQAAAPPPAEVASQAGRQYGQWLAPLLGLFLALVVGGEFGIWPGVAAGLALAAGLLAVSALFGAAPAFRQGVVAPFRDFLERNGAGLAATILAFISLYKASDVLLTLMANPFYLEVGFSKSQIAWVSGTFGFFVTFLGAYLAGILIYRKGILPGLWIAGVLMMASNLMFALQAHVGADYALFHATILIENLSGGMGTAAFVAYLASLCNRHYTAVQYALLTSFMNLLAKFVFVPTSGFLAEGVGWINFFLLSTLAGVPALLLLWWLARHPAVPVAVDLPEAPARTSP